MPRCSPEVRRRITWAICSRVKVERGTFTEVDVRKAVAPLFALAAFAFGGRARGFDLTSHHRLVEDLKAYAAAADLAVPPADLMRQANRRSTSESPPRKISGLRIVEPPFDQPDHGRSPQTMR